MAKVIEGKELVSLDSLEELSDEEIELLTSEDVGDAMILWNNSVKMMESC